MWVVAMLTMWSTSVADPMQMPGYWSWQRCRSRLRTVMRVRRQAELPPWPYVLSVCRRARVLAVHLLRVGAGWSRVL